MSGPTLSNPTIEVNDIVISIKPNSFTYKKGKGDRNVRAQSSGGNSVEMIVTDNAETKMAMAKFTVLTDQENVESVDTWLDSLVGVGNTIRASQGSFVLPFRGMHITTEPENSLGADGEIEVEFHGPPIP